MPCTYTYNLDTGEVTGAVNSFIPLTQQPNNGQGLIRTDEESFRRPCDVRVDIAQNPPILIDASAPIIPDPPDRITKLLATLVEKGVLAPEDVDAENLQIATDQLVNIGKTIK